MVLNSKSRPSTPSNAPAGAPTTTQATQPAAGATTGAATQPAAGAAPSWGNRGGSRPTAPASKFSGIRNAPAPMRRNSFLTDGDYVLRIEQAEYKAGREGDFVLVECSVIESSYDANDAGTHGTIKAGERVTIFIKKGDAFLQNLKGIILAASGFDKDGNPRPLEDEVTEEECEAFTGETQSLTGAFLYTEARTKPQVRDPNKTFTYLNHWPCPLKVENGQTFVDMEKLGSIKNIA